MQSPLIELNKIASDAILRVVNVSKSYVYGGSLSCILQDITFTISKGEVVAFVGRTGIGKSTVLDIVAGLQVPTAGSVLINTSVGYVMQKDLLLAWRTVLRNVSLPLEFNGSLHNLDKAETILQDLALTEHTHAYPGTLSGGTKQKMSVARVLLQDPDLLLLDEPFSAMDVAARIYLIQYLRRWVAQKQAGVAIVTHSIDEALAFADRIIVMKGSPACIGASILVKIPNEFRDPVAVRQFSEYAQLFNLIWAELSSDSRI
jgi:NitT/TauT family transport system ATP-binding protein